eukprot:m.28267 g.28267  ORF g.28267 m.28267 type:complete len:65 (+) comp14106_c0_seq1:2718-2912(+)
MSPSQISLHGENGVWFREVTLEVVVDDDVRGTRRGPGKKFLERQKIMSSVGTVLSRPAPKFHGL